MKNIGWNKTGWSRLQEQAKSCGYAEDNGVRLGLIGLDWRENGLQVDKRTSDRHWTEWLREALPDENVWFVDRISSHLWFVAEATECSVEAAEACLAAIARRLRQALGAAPGVPEDGEGFGVALMKLASGRSAQEAAYDALLDAVGRMRRWQEAAPADRELRREMERILQEQSIRSVFQPIMRIATGEVFGFEALTRCPDRCHFDGPQGLFQFAEREGYAYSLDRLAREKAIRSCPPLNAAQKIFLNVTSGIMKDPGFVSGQTIHWLRQRGLHPGQIVLELTERSSIDDFSEAKKVLEHYRSQGYEIAIDDAGAGYSSLQSIVELQPDYIKVDKSLVQNADRDEMKKQMLRTFVRFARRMDIRTVAEGIERPEELRLLRTLGIDFGQGYLLGRPGEYGTGPVAGGLPNG
ncbi:EAL domain-containing protein [Cohnella lubricantis]|uniref:EAL domain-containing protein n=1 Tax=Cohnella lubricantis TaxID=2163172 RepID=A0A841T5A3_9BACL|nr:EAL domain-containing protein [Cohnella lubricantis]MBB6676042.1 EAL domain-containing protein [Cohnella lubricantis]MBP2117996.1 EAL domain-containing protein (putative c-di-GMP-specific phosphodiesterase class I) [Cohnella lubricantis]